MVRIPTYDRIINMIESSTFEDKALLKMFSSEDLNDEKSLYCIIRNLARINEDTNIEDDYQILVDALTEYIDEYATSSAIKNRLCARILAWCKHMGIQYNIENYEEYFENFPTPVDTDIVVEIIKKLHNQDGISKEDLKGNHDISTKKIQVLLSKITNKRCIDPVRIGGQAVHVPISYHKSNIARQPWKYYTKNTMSPLVFQMNIMQAETLMKSLQLNYESGNDIPLDLAIDTWSQLSEYARNRIREKFGERDADLAKFLDKVEEKMHTDGYRFMTEAEIFEKEDLSYKEKLEIAYKSGIICNISLFYPHHITRKNQRIFYDHEKCSFYSITADNDNSDRLYFTEEEIDDIYKA